METVTLAHSWANLHHLAHQMGISTASGERPLYIPVLTPAPSPAPQSTGESPSQGALPTVPEDTWQPADVSNEVGLRGGGPLPPALPGPWLCDTSLTWSTLSTWTPNLPPNPRTESTCEQCLESFDWYSWPTADWGRDKVKSQTLGLLMGSTRGPR